MKFFEAVGNIFRIPDLRKRVLFTLGLLAVYRLGGHIPTPGINLQRWQDFELPLVPRWVRVFRVGSLLLMNQPCVDLFQAVRFLADGNDSVHLYVTPL